MRNPTIRYSAGMRVISATTAARRFREMLDDVERGEDFMIERHGRVVATLSAPLLPSRRVTGAQVMELLRSGPHPDEKFAADLRAIRRSSGRLPRKGAWERYSTRRS
jgi:antitoxin (DNA-binding transcriptional repressor) of toxin-antitoxin stability system